MRLDFDLQLEQDVAVSATSSTTGGHETLSYIPGGLMLGAVARNYSDFGGFAWDVFHSGAVRFLNAYPSNSTTQTVPVPLSVSEHSNGLNKAWRGAFLADGRVFRPELTRRQKTAIERSSRGAPRKGSMFDVEAISAHQSFSFPVLIADNLVEDVLPRILDSLSDVSVFLGRSRSAEFGRVHCTRSGPHDSSGPRESQTRVSALVGKRNLTVYCTSDIVVGFAPTIEALFGLPAKWKLNSERSSFRFHSITRFNGFRRSYATDARVLTRGSVLSFIAGSDAASLTDADAQLLINLVARGAGSGVAEGFGEFLLDPSFLTDELTENTLKPFTFAQGAPEIAPRPQDALFAWADKQSGRSDRSKASIRHAQNWVWAFSDLYEEAREAAIVSKRPLSSLAPSKAQWGRVREIAQSVKDLERIKNALFESNEGLLCTGTFKLQWQYQHSGGSFESKLQEFLLADEIGEDSNPGLFAAESLLSLAAFVPRMLATSDIKAEQDT